MQVILLSRPLMETPMIDLTYKFVLLTITGALLACGSNLSSASNVSNAIGKADANGGAEQQEPMDAKRPAPFACPAEVLAIMAKALNQASMTDAQVVDGKEPVYGSSPSQAYQIIWGD
jgi:hypothetical protein